MYGHVPYGHDAISAVELFQAHLTGTATKEFEQIAFDVTQELYSKYISLEYNRGLSIYDAEDKINSAMTEEERKTKGLDPTQYIRATETEKWFQRNNERKDGRLNQPVAD